MLSRWRPLLVPALLLLAAIDLFYYGWLRLWFLTDDAYIFFRYASNSQLGYGYVWNGPPFLPVEGYTSLLWLAMLDGVWSLFGIEPTVSSNWLAFAFGIATLALTSVMLMRMRLAPQLAGLRIAFLCLVLLGLTTNFNFLMWSSSGLETSLFNFLFLAWIAAALYLRAGSNTWITGVSLCAALIELCRPDGLLVTAASAALIGLVVLARAPRSPRRLLRAWPLLLPIVHVVWRWSFYGTWLPNTFYAKQVAAWPEAGVRYLLSYILEYGLWLWLALGFAVAIRALRTARWRHWLERHLSQPEVLARSAVVWTVLVQVAYYTLLVGGDHFEYRVYSYTVPIVLLTTVWMANRLALSAMPALITSALVVALAIPIPWLVWAGSQRIENRRKTLNMTVPIAASMPPGLGGYGRAYDALQEWLIPGHAIGKRHREHQVFHIYRLAVHPRKRQLDASWYASHPVMAVSSVGVTGWILARAHVIDTMGLNDYAIARHPGVRHDERRMAHDRVPPDGYVECFMPNVDVSLYPMYLFNLRQLAAHRARLRIEARPTALTSERIARCEREWRAWIQNSR